MDHSSEKILTAILRPTRILGCIPQLLAGSLSLSILIAVFASFFHEPPLLWALISLITSYGISFSLTYYEEDFLRIQKTKRSFKKTKNYIPEIRQKYSA